MDIIGLFLDNLRYQNPLPYIIGWVKVIIKEHPWNCVLIITPIQERCHTNFPREMYFSKTEVASSSECDEVNTGPYFQFIGSEEQLVY